MSGRRAKALRKAAGNPPKKRKQKTPIIDASYIQAPVRYDFTKAEWVYRSSKQVRKYLVRRMGEEAVAKLEIELKDLFETEQKAAA